MTPIQYLSYTIQEDYRNLYSNTPEFMYFPTEEGIQHDADLVGEDYKYCGNCEWASSLEEAKENIYAKMVSFYIDEHGYLDTSSFNIFYQRNK